MSFPDKKYDIILADPPWHFKNYSDKWHKDRDESRWVGNEYPLMTIQDIINLPVKSIAAKDAALFLWVTMPMLPVAFKVIEGWGFTYKTCAFTWIKKNKVADSFFTGMGFWTRSNSELCLLATKGNPKRVSKSVRQLIVEPVGKHSEKPKQARERIVALLGDLPRIELFARERVDGWSSWGLEVGCNE